MSKHLKPARPSDADLKGNPLISASGGLRMAGASAGDLDAIKGENTVEGDRANDVNAQGGLDRDDRKRRRT